MWSSRLQRMSRIAYVTLAWAFVMLVVMQVYLAGLAVFISADSWALHKTMGHLVALPLMLMFVLGLAGRLPRRFPGFALGLFGLYFMQYVFLNASLGATFLPAFHAVNALVLVVCGVGVARTAGRNGGK